MTGTCNKAMMLYLAALLSLGGVAMGCGDDDDGGDTDAGTDAGGGMDDGGFDAGTDAGECVPDCTDRDCGDDGCGGTCGDLDGMCPGGFECDEGECPNNVFARLAHLAPNAGNVRLCVYVGGAPTGIGPIPAETPATDDVDFIPFGAVSGYIPTFTADPVEYLIKVFSVDDVTTSGTCPMADAATPTPVFEDTINGGDLEVANFYTIAAVGFGPEDDGSAPSVCGADFATECEGDQLAHIEVYDDDVTPPTDDTMSKVRLVNGVPNFHPTMIPNGVEICWDPDLSDDTDTEVKLFDAVYPTASDYLEIDPIPGDVTTGGLRLYAHQDAADCVIAARLGDPIPLPYPAATGVGTDAVPGSVAEFEANTVQTIFMGGNSSPAASEDTTVVIPYADVPPE